MRRRRHAFTLVELLIVIAIVGILVAVVGVGARGLLDRGRLGESLNAVEARIGEARRLAKRLDRNVTLSIVLADGVWRTVVDGVAKDVPGSPLVTSGPISVDFEAPFGTYAGGTEFITLAVNEAQATITVTGVLAKTVVAR